MKIKKGMEEKKKKSKKGMKSKLSVQNSLSMKSKPPKENPFESIWSRKKFNILGKKRKEDERRLVGRSRSLAIQKREKTLLKEYEQSGKSSVFLDKRIGEQNEGLEEFDKAILRSQRERQLKLKKSSKYNLSDGEEDDFDFGDGYFPERDDYVDDGALKEDDHVHFSASDKKITFGQAADDQESGFPEGEKNLVEIMSRNTEVTKISRKSCQANGEDNISKLPESVICHILSRLPSEEAVRTSILSKDWHSKLTSIYNIEKKHVVIYYTGQDYKRPIIPSLVYLPVDSLIPPKTPPSGLVSIPCKKFYLELPRYEGVYFNFDGSSLICTTSVGGERSQGPGLYSFGGVESCGNHDRGFFLEYLKEVKRYDPHKLCAGETGSIKRCKDMMYGMSGSLSTQVGDDCIYVLGHGKIQDDDRPKPVFLEYNFKEDEWTLLNDDDHFVDMVNMCDYDKRLCRVPHVVIGHKLHVSFGNSSFTFDTNNRAWEDCKLFETFWSKEEAKKSGLSPSNFYGKEVWHGANYVKRRKSNKFGGGGPPFGFYGRGILWDKNILLGVHYAENCPLVAFMLDDETGRVVKSQRVSMDKLVLDYGTLHDGACLVDLGRDGYFGLVHFLDDKETNSSRWIVRHVLNMELVTFKVSRPPPQEIAAASDDDDDHFLDCQVVGKECVVGNLRGDIGDRYNAFCGVEVAINSSRFKESKVVAGEGLEWRAYDFSREQKTKHVVIYHHTDSGGSLFCVPVDRLISVEGPYLGFEKHIKEFKLELPCPVGEDSRYGFGCICTTSVGGERSRKPDLYFFGGVAPPYIWNREPLQREKHFFKDVYHYEIHKLPEELGRIIPRQDMKYGMFNSLLAQVGDDCIYVLGHGKAQADESLKPVFLEYNFKRDKWTLLNDIHFLDIIHNCDSFDSTPHVVIGSKLHVSLGNSSFTFDTVNRIWEDCELFETFWSKQEKKKSRRRLTPDDFYGYKVCEYAHDLKKRKRNKIGGGPPFGFSGRGILWDKNILLGVCPNWPLGLERDELDDDLGGDYSKFAGKRPLVAFLLDEDKETGTPRVVKSQPLKLDLGTLDKYVRIGNDARLVDLGGDGYLGLVHTLCKYDYKCWADVASTQLVTFKVTKIATAADDAPFLECKVVSKVNVVKDFEYGVFKFHHAFCL